MDSYQNLADLLLALSCPGSSQIGVGGELRWRRNSHPSGLERLSARGQVLRSKQMYILLGQTCLGRRLEDC